MIGFAVLVGIAVASPDMLLSIQALLGFLTGFFISGYSMVINDYYDLEVDRINNPSRPLVKGEVSIEGATVYALILVSIGIVASTFTSIRALSIAAAFAAISWTYNYWGKKRGILGNCMVAASIAIPFIYGGVSIGASDNPLLWLLALTSFLAGVGREVIKSICDVVGDELRGIRSVARVYGSKRAAEIGAALFASAIVSAFIPILLNIVGLLYTILILVPDAIFLYLILKILKDYSKENALWVKKVALIGMLTGLIAFILGGVYWI